MITFERITAVLFAACLVLLPLPGAGKAGCRAVVHYRQQQAAVVFQPVYQQPYWYSVGQNYQIAAIVQETLKAQQLMQNQQQLNYQSPVPQCPDGTCPPQPQTLPLTAESPRMPMTQKCVACHNGTNAKATQSLDLSDLSRLDCETKLLMIGSAVKGRMPKGKPLSPEELGTFIGEMTGESP